MLANLLLFIYKCTDYLNSQCFAHEARSDEGSDLDVDVFSVYQ